MKTFIAGHRGLVGASLHRLIPDAVVRSRAELDLRRSDDVDRLFASERPRHVYLAAAEVGGIQHNMDRPADMIRSNLAIQVNVIDACHRFGVERLCFMGSSCIYPRESPQPIPEFAIMTGPLEPTNSAYAMAKLAGIEMCQAYAKQHGLRSVCLMPTNLYGPHGFAGTQATHVVPMLMRRFHAVKDHGKSIDDIGRAVVSVWGTGRALREFMHVDDLARAAVHFMSLDGAPPVVNVGTGAEISIHALAIMIAEIVGYAGDIEFDHTKPDGTPRKVLDVSLAAKHGWTAQIPLHQGLEETYGWMVRNVQA